MNIELAHMVRDGVECDAAVRIAIHHEGPLLNPGMFPCAGVDPCCCPL